MLVGATRAATVLERTCDASSVRAVDVIEEVGTRSEELIAANSMALHELYFACLGGDGKLKPAGKPAGFGVGLSWGAVAADVGPLVIPELQYLP